MRVEAPASDEHPTENGLDVFLPDPSGFIPDLAFSVPFFKPGVPGSDVCTSCAGKYVTNSGIVFVPHAEDVLVLCPSNAASKEEKSKALSPGQGDPAWLDKVCFSFSAGGGVGCSREDGSRWRRCMSCQSIKHSTDALSK